jgi:DNA-binding transcriptional LysR family regulator
MDWEDLRHFAAFAASGSLSAAARRLGVEHATVARRIAALEMRLDLKLIDRRGRRLALTADGRRIAAVTDRMETDINAIDRIASGARSDLSGEVTISAPSAYAAAILATPLARLRKRHPDLRVRLLGEARSYLWTGARPISPSA